MPKPACAGLELRGSRSTEDGKPKGINQPMTMYYPGGAAVKRTKDGVSRYLETVAKPAASSFLDSTGQIRGVRGCEWEMGWDNKDVAEAYFHATKEIARLEAVIAVIEAGDKTLPLELYP